MVFSPFGAELRAGPVDIDICEGVCHKVCKEMIQLQLFSGENEVRWMSDSVDPNRLSEFHNVIRGRIDIEATLRLMVALTQKVYFFRNCDLSNVSC